MTVPVPDQLEYISDANGVTKDFSYPKRFLQKDEIVVALRNADGIDTPQILGTHYTIAGSSWPTGGTVSFINAPQAPNKVVRYRMTQAKQTVDLENKQRNDAKAVEVQLDRLTMAIQDREGRTDSAWFGLAAEIAARKAGDITLQQNIDSEQQARVAGDNALNKRIDTEIGDRITGDAAIASLIGQSGYIEVPVYDTCLAVTFARIKLTIQAIRTSGYSLSGDYGAALYKRVTSEPAHAGKVQSADGAWWEIASLMVNPKHFGAIGDGVTDDLASIQSAIEFCQTKSAVLEFPPQVFAVSAVPTGLSLIQRRGKGLIVIAENEYRFSDDDVLRYDPSPNNGDYSVRIAQNRSDLNPDPAKRGHYFFQQYTSNRPGTGSLFGYAANIFRTGGDRKVVAAQLNGYSQDAAGTGSAGSVWGIATEAWTGGPSIEPVRSATLIGGEFAVLSQYHDNTAKMVGVDSVFKNRPDNASEVIRGNAGNNRFNVGSAAFQISTGNNKDRPASGAFTGWHTGILFTSNSLDESVEGKAVGIDMSAVKSARMKASLLLPGDVPVSLGTPSGGAGIHDGFIYRTSGGRRIDFVRDITGSSPVIRSTLDLSLDGPTGTIVAFSSTTTAYV